MTISKHYYCRLSLKESNVNKVKLTGKFERESGGRHEAFVYNENRVQVFHSQTACCVYAAQEAYLESLAATDRLLGGNKKS